MALYSNRQIAPQVVGRNSELQLPLPFGGLNTVLSAADIDNDQCSEALNKWINFEGRLASYWDVQDIDMDAITNSEYFVKQYVYTKDDGEVYHMLAWHDGNTMFLGYVDNGNFVMVDSALTKGEIHFEQYMSLGGTVVETDSTATGGTSDTVVNSASNYTVNALRGQILEIVSGTGAGQFREVKSNTETTITVYDDWFVAPDSTTVYKIREIAYSLFYLTETDGLREWNGSLVIQHDGIENGRAMRIFNNINFIAGGKDGNTIYVSTPYAPYDFTQGYADRVEKTPYPVTAIAVYQGNLVIFKETLSVVLQGSYSQTLGFTFQQLKADNTRGCVSSRGFCEVDGNLLVLDELGVYHYGYAPNTDTLLGVQERITDTIRNNIETATIKPVNDYFGGALYYNKTDDQVWLTFHDGTGDVCYNTVFSLDWNRRTQGYSWWKFDIVCNDLINHTQTYITPDKGLKITFVDRTSYRPTSFIKTKAYNLGSNYGKIVKHIRFFARNIAASFVGLRVHLWTTLHDVEIVDKAIYLGTGAAPNGGVGNDPIGEQGIGSTQIPQGTVLQSLLRKVLLPAYPAYHVQLEWYNEDNTNFELDRFSIKSEALSDSHDPLTIQI